MSTGKKLIALLGLKKQPVAIAFRDAAPKGMTKIETSAPAGCTYWQFAADGKTFYTEAADHYGCPVGSHTHGVDLPADKAKELEVLIGSMVDLKYLDPAEVAGIPRRSEKFGVAIYAPLANAAFEPDVVIVCGNARQMMLVAEAAHAAGISSNASMVGRPTCAAIPAVMQTSSTATNLGCIGNRVYTGLADDELYFAVSGSQLDNVVEKLDTIVNANRELEKFHKARLVSC